VTDTQQSHALNMTLLHHEQTTSAYITINKRNTHKTHWAKAVTRHKFTWCNEHKYNIQAGINISHLRCQALEWLPIRNHLCSAT